MESSKCSISSQKSYNPAEIQSSQLYEFASKFFSDVDVFYRALPLDIEFVKQPPEDLRKSLFFDFAIQLKSADGPVHIERARFERFLNEDVSYTSIFFFSFMYLCHFMPYGRI